MDHAIQTRKLDLVLINMKKRTCQLVDFVLQVDHRIEIDKYLNFVRELKRL